MPIPTLNWVLISLLLGLIGIGNYAIAAHFDVLGQLSAFSRSNPDWRLGDVFLLALNFVPVVVIGLLLRIRQLNAAVRVHQEAEQTAQEMALRDPLTGLGNRLAFLSHLKMAMRSKSGADGGMLTTLLLDLDRFKPVNDLYGHAAGDMVLVVVAQRIRAEITEQDFMVRLGGDEFAVVLARQTTPKQAEALAQGIIDAIGAPIRMDGLEITVGVSIGIASSPASEAFSTSLAHADQALHATKRLRRNGYSWYDTTLSEQGRETASLENDLCEAIARDEIVPYFQPIVDIDTGRIEGFEVLARWIHPERGMIPPTIFIPIAETAGLIVPLSGSVLLQACQAAADWDPVFGLSVNISPRQVHDSVLVDTIRQIADETGFETSRLQVEVTENAVIADFELARAVLADLQGLGITVALDDFGTGFSSLASLRDLAFDRIKIDRSFVTNISLMPNNRKIVSGIMSLARELDLPVTGEGIETPEDLSFLRALGCQSGQGFLFERALPAADISWLLETKWSNHHVPEAVVQPRISMPYRMSS